MALHDPQDDLQYEAAVDRLTRERAFAILAAVKAGHPLNMAEMITMVGDYLADNHAFAELIQSAARGQNAFAELLQKLALEEGERQAREELASAPARRRAQAAEDRADMAHIDRALDARAAA